MKAWTQPKHSVWEKQTQTEPCRFICRVPFESVEKTWWEDVSALVFPSGSVLDVSHFCSVRREWRAREGGKRGKGAVFLGRDWGNLIQDLGWVWTITWALRGHFRTLTQHVHSLLVLCPQTWCEGMGWI